MVPITDAVMVTDNNFLKHAAENIALSSVNFLLSIFMPDGFGNTGMYAHAASPEDIIRRV